MYTFEFNAGDEFCGYSASSIICRSWKTGFESNCKRPKNFRWSKYKLDVVHQSNSLLENYHCTTLHVLCSFILRFAIQNVLRIVSSHGDVSMSQPLVVSLNTSELTSGINIIDCLATTRYCVNCAPM